ncbi:MAG: adenylate/guanylate cyclase domain-containing protein [Hydrogenophilaceae bacterium]|jgi:adenylate cyclase|nr:adenylate/guanylate cyclase domain-containing protein [Hydrogenophilaceae bacterium]
MSASVRRKLTTILAADADGYSRAMEADEVRAMAALQAARRVFAGLIERHHGRIANTAGDGLIAEFGSVVEAVQCAIEVQRELGADPDSALRFRIGVHLGDVMIDGDDLLGEGVNLAARLQAMAEPGGILISQQVYDQVQKKLSVGFEYLGERKPKNFEESVAVYGVTPPGAAPAKPAKGRSHQARAARPAARTAGAGELKPRIMRLLRVFGAIVAVLFAIDLATGGPMWAHWVALILATIAAYRAAPLMARGWLSVSDARLLVIIALLALINAFSWSGELWAIWPAAAIVLIALLGRLLARG